VQQLYRQSKNLKIRPKQKQTQRSKVEAKGEGLLICTGEWQARGAKRGNSSPSVWNGSGIEEALNQTDGTGVGLRRL